MSAGPTIEHEPVDPAAGLPDANPEQAALTSDWGGARRVRATPVGPKLGPVGWLRWSWRQLTSMRTALVLLFLLAVAAIPGSMLPQRGTSDLNVNNWIEANPGTSPLLDRLGLFEVFTSPWFSAIYILLFVSLIGCVLPRIGAHWRSMRAPTPPAPRRLDRLPGARTWITDPPDAPDGSLDEPDQPDATDPPDAPEDVLARAAEALRAQRWRVTPGQGRHAGSLAAEKGFTRETGNLLFHVALVLLLIGVALGSLFGWKGTVIVREGNGFSNTLTQYDSFTPGRLAGSENLPPFSFTMTDFTASFEREGSQRGAPRSFAATLEYSPAPGEPTAQKLVSVNAPLSLDGAKVFLVGHGYAPHLRLTDSTGAVVFDDTVAFLPQDGNFTSTGVVKAPDGTPQLGVQGLFLPTAALDEVRGPHSSFPAADDPALFASAWSGDLGLDTGVPSNVFTLDTEGMDQLGLQALRPGQTWDFPDGQGSLEFVELERWASFTISHDPGKGLALAAAIAAIVGVMLSLFVRRRRIWVRVDAVDDEDGAERPGRDTDDAAIARAATLGGRMRVQVAGLSRSDSADVTDEVAALVAVLGGPTEQFQTDIPAGDPARGPAGDSRRQAAGSTDEEDAT